MHHASKFDAVALAFGSWARSVGRDGRPSSLSSCGAAFYRGTMQKLPTS